MQKVLDELASTFKMISSIPVTGEAVDIMATARNSLRKAYAEVERMSREKAEEEKNER